jgi:hypothetical protein
MQTGAMAELTPSQIDPVHTQISTTLRDTTTRNLDPAPPSSPLRPVPRGATCTEGLSMPIIDELIAWIGDHALGGIECSFIRAANLNLAPARRCFSFADAAREWVTSEASEMDMPIQSVDAQPGHSLR